MRALEAVERHRVCVGLGGKAGAAEIPGFGSELRKRAEQFD